MEKSKVYFTSFKATGNENLLQKLHRLMKTADLKTLILRISMQRLKFILENMEILRSYVRTMQEW